MSKSILKSLAPVSVGLLTFSCTNPDYRTVVHTGAEGQVDVERVPYQAGEKPVSLAPQSAAPTMAPQPPADPELAEIETLWPKLSDSDRSAIVDMAKHLAK